MIQTLVIRGDSRISAFRVRPAALEYNLELLSQLSKIGNGKLEGTGSTYSLRREMTFKARDKKFFLGLICKRITENPKIWDTACVPNHAMKADRVYMFYKSEESGEKLKFWYKNFLKCTKKSEP